MVNNQIKEVFEAIYFRASAEMGKKTSRYLGDIVKHDIIYSDFHVRIIEGLHRIPTIVFFEVSEDSILPRFSDILQMVSLFIEDDDNEILCCDTDMDSYEIHIFIDPEHGDYPDIVMEAYESILPEDTNSYNVTGFCLIPNDYHS